MQVLKPCKNVQIGCVTLAVRYVPLFQPQRASDSNGRHGRKARKRGKGAIKAAASSRARPGKVKYTAAWLGWMGWMGWGLGDGNTI